MISIYIFQFDTMLDPIFGLFGLLFSGPLLIIYGLFCYFVDIPVKGRKVLSIIGFASGILWMSYLLKACADGEFV